MLILPPFSLFAQDDQSRGKHLEEHYHFSIFAGYTTDHKDRTGYKLGIEYEYRVGDRAGIGGTFDLTGKDFEIFSLSVGGNFYPFSFPLIPAIGIGAKNSDNKWDLFFRGVLLYDFHVGNFSIGPMVMWDVYSEEKDIVSYGVTVGYSLH